MEFCFFPTEKKHYIYIVDFIYFLNYKDKCYKRFLSLNEKNKNKILSFTYEEDQQSKPAI